MKASNKDEEVIRFTARLPKDVQEKLEKSAKNRRRSVNDELITILGEYFAWRDEMVENHKKMEEMTPERLEALKNLFDKFDNIEKYVRTHPNEFSPLKKTK